MSQINDIVQYLFGFVERLRSKEWLYNEEEKLIKVGTGLTP